MKDEEDGTDEDEDEEDEDVDFFLPFDFVLVSSTA